ncbi:hypothetical protein LX36DRAFT_672134 [Colletotrichum falcatum]|nr:hypothetical protein LX36DRAFT_672134 [Colletotrichum falcatum]
MDSDTDDAAAPSEAHDETVWDSLKSCMPPLTCDPRGDLTLRIGKRDIIVCSRTLTRSSAVFRAMILTGFAESKPAGESTWTVDLPDDEFHPTLLLLTIIHGNFASVPEKLKSEELYQLLVVADKYDMIHALKPMVPTWYRPDKEATTIAGNEIFLWIAWVLGDKKTSKILLSSLYLPPKSTKMESFSTVTGNPSPRTDLWSLLVSLVISPPIPSPVPYYIDLFPLIADKGFMYRTDSSGAW